MGEMVVIGQLWRHDDEDGNYLAIARQGLVWGVLEVLAAVFGAVADLE